MTAITPPLTWSCRTSSSVTGVSSSKRRPSWVYDHGTEPDPRFTLANERTFLAWIRTSLALLAGAAAVHAFDLDVSDTVAAWSGGLLAVGGLLCALQAWFGWARNERALREERPLPSSGVGAVLAAAVAVVALILLVIGSR